MRRLPRNYRLLRQPKAQRLPNRLPLPQRTALDTTFGLTSGSQPDRFVVGLGVVNLLSFAAEQQPLLCVVDDAQWLDQASAQTLEFVARADWVTILSGLICMSDVNRTERVINPWIDPPLFAESVVISPAINAHSLKSRSSCRCRS